jgi:Na+/pantothenate symporter
VSVIVGLVSLAIALKPPALILVLTGFAWAVIASTNLWPLLFGIYWKRASRLAAFVSMAAGALTALIWTWAGNPWGIHGFIAGSVAGLVLIVLLSFIKWNPPEGYLERIWGEE